MKPEEIKFGAMALVCRRMRNTVLAPLGHEEFRAMLRETYPLRPHSEAWLERFGHELIPAENWWPQASVSRELVEQALGRMTRAPQFTRGPGADLVIYDEEPGVTVEE